MTDLLLIEDDDVVREATALALERYGYAVATAGDGLAGLDAVRAQRPELVLLDVMLPLLDGFSVCRAIRAESMVPIIMLTARRRHRRRPRARGRRRRLRHQAV